MKIIITGGDEISVSEEKGNQLLEWKYGKNGGKPQPAQTPVELENYGTVALQDIKRILYQKKTKEEAFTTNELEGFLATMEGYKGIDDYCLSQGYIFYDNENVLTVRRETIQEYTQAKELHKEAKFYKKFKNKNNDIKKSKMFFFRN